MEKVVERLRVGLITSHPAPYRDATYSYVCSKIKLGLQVLFMFDCDEGHAYWGTSRKHYANCYLGPPLFVFKHSVFNANIVRVLHRYKFDILCVDGHYHLTSLVALACALAWHIPFIYVADSIMAHSYFRGKSRLRDALVKFIVSRAGAVWVPGVASREYMIHYGAPEGRIFQGSYCLDVDGLIEENNRLHDRRIELRRYIGIKDEMAAFLMVGNLIPSRRHELLLKAFARLGLENKVFLILIGDGSERLRMEALCCQMQIRNVKFYQGVPFDNLKFYYAASDVYIHSGYEPYSTALDYGAIAALPLITTTGVGAAYNYQGLFDALPLTDPDDEDGLLKNMRRVAADPSFVKSLGQKFRERIQTRNVKWAASQLNAAIVTALGVYKTQC